MDELELEKEREQKSLDAMALRCEKAALDAVNSDLDALIKQNDLLARAALMTMCVMSCERYLTKKQRRRKKKVARLAFVTCLGADPVS